MQVFRMESFCRARTETVSMLWMSWLWRMCDRFQTPLITTQSTESHPVLLALRRLKYYCDDAVTIRCITMVLALFDTALIRQHNICTINTSKIWGTYLRPMVMCPKKLRVEIQHNEQDIRELAQILHFCGKDSICNKCQWLLTSKNGRFPRTFGGNISLFRGGGGIARP